MRRLVFGGIGRRLAKEVVLEREMAVGGKSASRGRLYRLRDATAGPGATGGTGRILLSGEELDALCAWWRREKRVTRVRLKE